MKASALVEILQKEFLDKGNDLEIMMAEPGDLTRVSTCETVLGTCIYLES